MQFSHLYTRLPLSMFDLGGVLHHAAYLKLLEDLRERYLECRGYSYASLMKLGYHLPLTSAEQTFKKPIAYDQKFTGTVAITKLTKVRFTAYHELRTDMNELIHTCSTEHACVNIRNGSMKASPLPAALADILASDLVTIVRPTS